MTDDDSTENGRQQWNGKGIRVGQEIRDKRTPTKYIKQGRDNLEKGGGGWVKKKKNLMQR